MLRKIKSVIVYVTLFSCHRPCHMGLEPAIEIQWMELLTSLVDLKANSHLHARHDKTVLCVSRPLRWCELDSRQLKIVADRKFEVWTRSEHRPVRTGTPDTTRTGPSCRVWCELSLPDRRTSAFSVGVCRAAQCDRRTHSDAERTCRADSIHSAWHDTDVCRILSCRVWRAVWIGHDACGRWFGGRWRAGSRSVCQWTVGSTCWWHAATVCRCTSSRRSDVQSASSASRRLRRVRRCSASPTPSSSTATPSCWSAWRSPRTVWPASTDWTPINQTSSTRRAVRGTWRWRAVGQVRRTCGWASVEPEFASSSFPRRNVAPTCRECRTRRNRTRSAATTAHSVCTLSTTDMSKSSVFECHLTTSTSSAKCSEIAFIGTFCAISRCKWHWTTEYILCQF